MHSHTAEDKEVRSFMSFRAKRELLLQIAPRYREASTTQKGIILDEFVAATGYVVNSNLKLLKSATPKVSRG